MMQPPPPPIQSRKNGLATWSLICGIGGIFTLFLTGIPAIITGHMALGRIRRGAAVGGSGAATTGLILGYVTTALGILIVPLAALATPQIYKALKRAALAEALNNARQVKYAMDGYASDHGGLYPEAEPGTSGQWSNDYFRPLFLDQQTESESIFWVKESPVAGDPPDEVIWENGNPASAQILQPGDVHWAYMSGQINTGPGNRPLILDCFSPRTSEFDPELWDRKVIVVRIDGSAKPMRMRITDGKVLDGSNRDILSPQADAWRGSGENPAALLKQPEPR